MSIHTNKDIYNDKYIYSDKEKIIISSKCKEEVTIDCPKAKIITIKEANGTINISDSPVEKIISSSHVNLILTKCSQLKELQCNVQFITVTDCPKLTKIHIVELKDGGTFSINIRNSGIEEIILKNDNRMTIGSLKANNCPLRKIPESNYRLLSVYNCPVKSAQFINIIKYFIKNTDLTTPVSISTDSLNHYEIIENLSEQKNSFGIINETLYISYPGYKPLLKIPHEITETAVTMACDKEYIREYLAQVREDCAGKYAGVITFEDIKTKCYRLHQSALLNTPVLLIDKNTKCICDTKLETPKYIDIESSDINMRDEIDEHSESRVSFEYITKYRKICAEIAEQKCSIIHMSTVYKKNEEIGRVYGMPSNVVRIGIEDYLLTRSPAPTRGYDITHVYDMKFGLIGSLICPSYYTSNTGLTHVEAFIIDESLPIAANFRQLLIKHQFGYVLVDTDSTNDSIIGATDLEIIFMKNLIDEYLIYRVPIEQFCNNRSFLIYGLSFVCQDITREQHENLSTAYKNIEKLVKKNSVESIKARFPELLKYIADNKSEKN